MSNKKWGIGALVLIGVGLVTGWLIEEDASDWFVDHSFPVQKADRLFDMGIVDANSDGLLDVYTSNHHFRQLLLVADGQGGYRDVVSDWGLDQSKDFPHAELSFAAPAIDRPGLYIYWVGTQLIIRAHEIGDADDWQGTMRVNDPVDILKQEGITVEKQDQDSPFSETVIHFSPSNEGMMRMRPGGQGLPIAFRFNEVVSPSQIYVGRAKVSPQARSFSLAMRDRHAMAWADYNADGILDVFINRGALGGTLRRHTEKIRSVIKDEFFLSLREGEYMQVGSDLGISKRGCSGRHARWLDVNNDGLLDLFVNCYDRGNVEGVYPKQLYRQDNGGSLKDVAGEIGLDLAEQQIASFGWFDVDDDNDMDMLAFQDEGLFLYRNEKGLYSQEPIARQSSEEAEKIGHTTGSSWFYDGKFTLADFDADGDLDAFSASKRGNKLLVNLGGKFSSVDPSSVGLPERSATANWVDYDNDGKPDLHVVPQGLYQQLDDHEFSRTGLLDFPTDKYDAAICNWFDVDNDGRLDVLMALHENPYFKRWWEFSKEPRRSSTWTVGAFRNVGAENNWLQLKLVGGAGNQQAIGARVVLFTPSGKQTQEVGGTEGAFFSQGHYRLYFGLGPDTEVEALQIRWSDGFEQQLRQISANRLLVVERGK